MNTSIRALTRLVLSTGLSAVLSIPPLSLTSVYSAAYAQDDDGGDDDGGGGGGGGAGAGSSSERRTSRNPGTGLFGKYLGGSPRYKAPRQKKATRAKAAPLARYRDREIVAIGLSQAEIDALAGRGYAVTEQVTVAIVAAQMVRLSAPRGTTLETARADVRAVNATAVADFNHFYRPQQASDCQREACLAWAQLQWPASATAGAGCGGSVRIGMVDTAVNTEHEALQSARIELIDTSARDARESSAGHGTAVAALLVGARSSRTPGLLPAAQLIAADPFERKGSDERGDVFAVVTSIDALASKNVHAINLSFAGPDNDLLDRIVTAVSSRGIPLIAASGNAGAGSPPLYPAAYQAAIAVTAVDRNRNIYRRAVRGDHIDFAAPGVDVWTAASVKGGRTKTGTSFATPFVTAAAALIKAGNPQTTPQSISATLSATTSDLGEPAKDKVFGYGLIQAAGLCGSGPEALPVSAQ
jgi:subtilisin family serine protease